MTTATVSESMISLDEINRALDLARERDPSIEPEPGYSDGVQSEPQLSAGNHATNLSILAAAALFRGQASSDALRVATELYKHVQQLARQY
jgi:hypothetical protein